MADSSEPKKETVRITVSPQPSASSTAVSAARDTVRIHLPTRPPPNPAPAAGDSAPGPRAAAAAVQMPAPAPPKKETARITVLPDPPAKAAVQMKKTQPLIDLPRIDKPVAPVTIAAEPQKESSVQAIPIGICWGLLAASVAILILQIWNYLS